MKTITVMTSSLLVLLTLAVVGGCSPKSASMTITSEDAPKTPQPPPASDPKPVITPTVIPEFAEIPNQKIDLVEFDGGGRQLESKPQVDILFVIDNSDSMRSAQEKVSANIHKFSNEIANTKMIDYHIGVISVWDYSKRFTEHRPDNLGIGDLRPVKGAGGDQTQRFVTRNETPLLAATLNIGVQAYKDGGPEVEEFFGPLAAALDKTGHGAANEGFFRPEAQLVVIFMTDADEPPEEVDPDSGTPRLSTQGMYSKLVTFKGGDRSKVSAYGVLVPQNAPDVYKDYGLRITPKYHPECFDMTLKVPKLNGLCPTAFGPQKLESFIMKANGASGAVAARKTFIKNITETDFSAALKDIGAGISKKTLQKVIYLSGARPRLDENFKPEIVVRYGTPEELAAGKGQVIPFNLSNGWSYNLDQNAVVLSGNIKYEDKANAKYSVQLRVAPRYDSDEMPVQ